MEQNWERLAVALDPNLYDFFRDDSLKFLNYADQKETYYVVGGGKYDVYFWIYRDTTSDETAEAGYFFEDLETVRHSAIHIIGGRSVQFDILTTDEAGTDPMFGQIFDVVPTVAVADPENILPALEG